MISGSGTIVDKEVADERQLEMEDEESACGSCQWIISRLAPAFTIQWWAIKQCASLGHSISGVRAPSIWQ